MTPHLASTLGRALGLAVLVARPVHAADLILSAQDGKFVRVDDVATFPEPAPRDSRVVLDASKFPPVVKATVDVGLEHTVQGPPQAVAITPDGKLAIGPPTRGGTSSARWRCSRSGTARRPRSARCRATRPRRSWCSRRTARLQGSSR